VIWQLAADAAAEPTTSIERIVLASAPVALALIALFSKTVRSKVQGADPEKPPSDAPAATAKTVSQTVADGAGLQHLLVVGLQRQLDQERAERMESDRLRDVERQRADEQLAAARKEVADLRVTVAELEGQVARMRAGWDRG
jgi:hypothetical protein